MTIKTFDQLVDAAQNPAANPAVASPVITEANLYPLILEVAKLKKEAEDAKNEYDKRIKDFAQLIVDAGTAP
jgi:hypothetical protein